MAGTASAHGGGCNGPFGGFGYGVGYGYGGPIGGGYGNAALAMGAYGPFVQPYAVSYPVIYNRAPVIYGGGRYHGNRYRGHSGVSISVRF
jgi:hypothetical protein